tara:strand:+ start:155 stop:724 length:570 start_codon:yes stop_codon:yes gene_type:complete
MNKRTPFYLKGMSFKDGQTPIKQTKGSLFKPTEGGLFKPNLFSNKISDDFKERTGSNDQESIDKDKAYIKQEASKYKSETEPFVDKDPGGAADDKTQQPASNTRGINPELAMAATMPLNYLIGKGLTALVNRTSKKKQQAKELDKQEKEVTATENKQNSTKQEDALTTTEDPKTAGKVVTEGGNVGQST